MKTQSGKSKIMKKPATVFSNLPILCPWITSQPYQSAVKIKNRSNELEKNSVFTNNSSLLQKNSTKSDLPTPNNYGFKMIDSSSHFFYFLRLMQLFPETHPATIHTVLTLTKNNFFHAIDKILYAKKCKNDLSKRNFFHAKPNVKHSNLSKNAFKEKHHDDKENFNLTKEQETTFHNKIKPVLKERPSKFSTQIYETCLNKTEKINKQFDLNRLSHPDIIEILCFENGLDNASIAIQNQIEENGEIVIIEEQKEDQRTGDIFLQDLTSNHQRFSEEMDIESDMNLNIIKLNSRPLLVTSKMENCNNILD